ncbi:S-methyl-5-thioribose-1-phosphate isomerase [bacterium B17]|nr:S-methyl-5-thioribose-1-phosphate isomerase [bacterium B17]
MNVNEKHYRTIWLSEDDNTIVKIIDQTKLPFKFEIIDITTAESMIAAISDMLLRGAGLIGAAAGYGMYLAALEASKSDDFETHLKACADKLAESRPTAVNLKWAVDRQLDAIGEKDTPEEKVQEALATANAIADEDAEWCRLIGEHGLSIIKEISESRNGEPVNILTHCNAGWLAFVDYGSATAPIYAAHDAGIPVHVWVDETRPRNQGAKLTAWELGEHGVPHTIIPDNTGGHLMQHGMVDLVITGADRVTRCGDAANKIGTYLKALAAYDNDVPFYVALPSSTFDWSIRDGIKEIPIEQRSEDEVKYMDGLIDGEPGQLLITPEKSPAANYGFDVTPARIILGLITERGICGADEEAIIELFPEQED